uniref:NAD(P)-binding domain-containing protein n=1 Tax=Oryza punctata TaxID=4537 RepID=A0A0E0M4V3_ORYPU
MEQAAKATISLSPSYAGCCMAACPYRSTRRLRRGSKGCSARSTSSLRHAPSAAPPRVYAAATPEPKTKEKDLVFIAGATGKVGSRAVRELIKLGFRVRAGVRSAQRASSLVQSVEQLKLDDDATSPAERLEIVECDLEKQAPADIVSAIGNAKIVACSIGASEKDILDVTGPYRIDYIATNNLVQAATAAKVEHFILVTSLGTNRIGFPAFLLNLFWGVLCWKRQAEEALIASGLPYTIVRPGGMERPTDAFKETHNLVVAVEDSYVGGLVSNLQVAELIACIASNRRAAYCKVVEAVAETTAPLLPTEDQLANIPSKRQPPPEIEIVQQGEKLAMTPPKPIQQSQRPLSPYTAFVDLKPPSSPSPCPPSAAAPVPTSTDTAAAGSSSMLNSSATGTPISVDQPKQQQRPLSPYTRYEELKPPSSPSPTPPSAASSTSVSASPDTPAAAAASSAALDSSANGTPITGDQLNQQQRPLSPYTRYEELKPPSSPTPSTPKP